jgi:type III restriction enzyme
VNLNVRHLADIRQSEILYRLTSRLLFKQFHDSGQDPKLYLFGQLKRIVRQWIDGGYLRCTGGTYLAQLIYQDLADRACERIKAVQSDRLDCARTVRHVQDAAVANRSSSVPRQLGGL